MRVERQTMTVITLTEDEESELYALLDVPEAGEFAATLLCTLDRDDE